MRKIFITFLFMLVPTIAYAVVDLELNAVLGILISSINIWSIFGVVFFAITAIIAKCFRVLKRIVINYEKKLNKLKEKARAGDKKAQYRLGLMFEEGEGIPRNYAESLIWYSKAARHGHVPAQHNLGRVYGDDIQAYKWVSIAKANGFGKAKKALDALEKRMGFKDVEQAQSKAKIFWYSKYKNYGIEE